MERLLYFSREKKAKSRRFRAFAGEVTERVLPSAFDSVDVAVGLLIIERVFGEGRSTRAVTVLTRSLKTRGGLVIALMIACV